MEEGFATFNGNPDILIGPLRVPQGSGGVDGQNPEAFAAQLDQQLDRRRSELKEETYQPQPVRQVQIPKAGKPGEFRTLEIRRFTAGCASRRC